MGVGGDTRLGSPLDPTFNISVNASEWRASWSVAATIISIVFGGYTIAVLFRRPWRPTLSFIIILLISDWFKAFWQFAYSVYWLVYQPTGLLEDNAWCQAEGFLFAWAIEMSDFTLTAMLTYVVFGVATRLHQSSVVVKVLSIVGYFFWFCVPIIVASLAFINNSGGYTNQSTTCYLPLRPYWYRLGLSWIPRYAMLFSSSAAILWLFIYVKSKHRSFMILLKRPDAESSNSQIIPRSTRRTTSSHLSVSNSPLYADVSEPLSPTSPRRVHLEPPTPELQLNDLLVVDEKPENLKSTGTGKVDSMATDSVTKSADEVLRRLRRLWVYPLVYFLYWTLPFAYHAMNYKLYFVLHPVTVMAGFSSTMVALHCAFMAAAVWAFERPGTDTEGQAGISVWTHLCDSCRPTKLFESGRWDKTAAQRQSASFAKQRLAIEQREYRTLKARQSAMSSMANVRDSVLVEDDREIASSAPGMSSGNRDAVIDIETRGPGPI